MQQSLSLLLQASKTGKQQATVGQKKPAAASRKRQPVVLSDSAGSEEEEEEQSSSEDETERLEIERVLDGRPHASSKQEEFLVKFKGNAQSLPAPCLHAPSLHADHPCLVMAEHAICCSCTELWQSLQAQATETATCCTVRTGSHVSESP